MHPALAADLFEAFEFTERIAVIIDPQVEIRPFVVAVDQQRRRLLAALVAACGLAGAHRRDQALRERQSFICDVGRRRIVQHAGAGEHVAGYRKTFALDVPAPIDAFGAGIGRDTAAGIHDVKLPASGCGSGLSESDSADQSAMTDHEVTRQQFVQKATLVESGRDDLFGSTIAGKYHIDAKLGAGGMGTVYRAGRLLIGDEVAIKILHSEQSDPKAGRRAISARGASGSKIKASKCSHDL